MPHCQHEYSRQDEGLGELLRYENVAWLEDGVVRILDRRVYPLKKHFVYCRTVDEIATAIADMVTQSAGPYTAAGMGMALQASRVKGQSANKQLQALAYAADRLSTARPTTASRMQRITEGALIHAKEALEKGEHDLTTPLFNLAFQSLERRYRRMARVGQYLVSLFPQEATVMTYCFGETIVGTMIRAAQEQGILLTLICPETRPYFQGARLTASVAIDMGADVTVITDNMSATMFSSQKVDLLTTAADAITSDGYVVNKVGTLQLAIAARYFGIPYFVTGIPDRMGIADITIEERDAHFVLESGGIRHTKPNVKGYYPAFDITAPHLVAGVVTDAGILTPYTVDRYHPPIDVPGDYYSGLEA